MKLKKQAKMEAKKALKRAKLANEILREGIAYYLAQDKTKLIETFKRNVECSKEVECTRLKYPIKARLTGRKNLLESMLAYAAGSDFIAQLLHEKDYFFPLVLSFCKKVGMPILLLHNADAELCDIHPVSYYTAFEALLVYGSREEACSTLKSMVNILSEIQLLEGEVSEKERFIKRTIYYAHLTI